MAAEPGLVKEGDDAEDGPRPFVPSGKMVAVRYLVSMVGERWDVSPGAEGEVDEKEAASLIRAGFAELVDDGKKKKGK